MKLAAWLFGIALLATTSCFAQVELEVDEKEPTFLADTDKWYVTLLTRHGCAYCDRLERDFAEHPALKAFANTDDRKTSWSNFNVCSMDDPAQSHRFIAPQSDIRIKGYPTLLVQPPSNGRYGSSQTIVLQKTGYDGNARKLAAQLRQSINQYAANAGRRTNSLPEVTARRVSPLTR
jgi:hypothetical protein